MPSLGQELKQAREDRGITLHDIANVTHIGVRFLQAIETDSYEVLPGGVFNRAFVRKFAKQVGYDEEQAIRLYEEQLEIQGIEPQKRYELGVEDFENKSSSGNGLLFSLLALVLLIAGAYVAWLLFNPVSADTKPGPVANASPTPIATTSPEPTVLSDASPSPIVSPEASPDASPAASSTPAPLSPGAMRLQLIANGSQCWISVKADEGKTEEILLNEGENREFMVNEKVVFVLGNYTALRMTINGRQINFEKLLPRQKGVVARNVVITKDNYQQFLD